MTNNKRYRECMAKIVGILQKYDMAGAITVIDKERSMFKYVFPTWGCISIKDDQLRIRSKRVDYPNAEAQLQTMELSVHIILQMRDIAAQTFVTCEHINKTLEQTFEIEHKPFHDFDPERSQ